MKTLAGLFAVRAGDREVADLVLERGVLGDGAGRFPAEADEGADVALGEDVGLLRGGLVLVLGRGAVGVELLVQGDGGGGLRAVEVGGVLAAVLLDQVGARVQQEPVEGVPVLARQVEGVLGALGLDGGEVGEQLGLGLGYGLDARAGPDLLVVDHDAAGEVPRRGELLAVVDRGGVHRRCPVRAAERGLVTGEVHQAAGGRVVGGLGVADLEDVGRRALGKGGGQLLLDTVPLLDLDIHLGAGVLLLEGRGDVLRPPGRVGTAHHPNGQRLALEVARPGLVALRAGAAPGNRHGHDRGPQNSDRRFALDHHVTLRCVQRTPLVLNGLDQYRELGLDL